MTMFVAESKKMFSLTLLGVDMLYIKNNYVDSLSSTYLHLSQILCLSIDHLNLIDKYHVNIMKWFRQFIANVKFILITS